MREVVETEHDSAVLHLVLRPPVPGGDPLELVLRADQLLLGGLGVLLQHRLVFVGVVVRGVRVVSNLSLYSASGLISSWARWYLWCGSSSSLCSGCGFPRCSCVGFIKFSSTPFFSFSLRLGPPSRLAITLFRRVTSVWCRSRGRSRRGSRCGAAFRWRSARCSPNSHSAGPSCS